MHKASGRTRPAPLMAGRRLLALLLAVILMSACTPPTTDHQLGQDVKALKAQVAALEKQLKELQAGQQAILAQLKKPTPMPPPAAPSVATAPSPTPPGLPTLTVAQLLTSKDRYLGTQVRVKGMAGPVMVHHKSLMLKSPQGGMVEVLFGSLPDQKLVQRLTASTLDQPITVTGVVNLAAGRGGGAQIQIKAEAIEF
jgi:outer membrane murein-binding lipoprotein Lpp